MHLYIHVPFCARRCSYCDFAIAVRREVPSAAFADTVLQEWAGWQSHPAWSRAPGVETVYFGGGTPSRLAPDALERILEQIWADRGIQDDAEITVEANPDDVTAGAAEAWRAVGVNRISLGAQSFDPAVLRWMHRTHTAEQVAQAFGILRGAGFGDVSLDLIFGLPGALERDWESDLARALELRAEHLSLYGLTIEEQTPLARWADRGTVTPVDDDRYAEEFLAADRMLEQAGYEHYEVSNYALPGHIARHNSAYWRRAAYIGLGPSAHSAFGSQRRWNLREWAAYQEAVGSGAPGVAGEERLDRESVRLEEIYLGLRTRAGVPIDRLPPEILRQWVGEGWAAIEGQRVRLSPEGWLRLDALVGSVAGVEGRASRV